MKTPFDTAIRWRKSELDSLRRILVRLEEEQALLFAQIDVLEKQFSAEERIARHQPLLNFAHFATLNRRERQLLVQDADRLEADIDEFRSKVAAAFQDYKALDIAAQNFRIAEDQQEARNFQAEMDDLSARNVVLFRRA
jgi:hypothetical protein